ncbi:ABC transporter I member 6, chloroplastic [Trebouxia sp. C0009 RCD-2024]
MLEVKGLEARVASTGEHILRGVNLTVREGEIHAIMGTNGSGKSTFSKVLVGHPDYEVTGGTATYRGKNLLELEPEERARSGLFMSFQSPVEVPGVSNAEFLRLSANARRMAQGVPELDPLEFYGFITPKLQRLNMDASFLDRNVNEGFSGGEKKRNEILQMSVLDAELSILDEIDSGLDIDALKDVASAVNGLTKPETATIMVTHYKRLLNHIKPDQVHVMESGKIIFSGDIRIADILEAEGYEGIRKAIQQQGSNGASQELKPAMSGNPD